MDQEHIRTFTLAGMIADAVGVPYEFLKRDTFHANAMVGHGTYDVPAGSWSDDSSLTLMLMATLTRGGSYDDYMRSLEAYVSAGAFTPSGEMFDIGNTTRQAVGNFVHGAPTLESGDPFESANGNGAIMRLSPLAITLLAESDAAVRRRTIMNWTAVTHRHERAMIGSVFYVELLRALLRELALPDALATVHEIVGQADFDSTELAYYEPLFAADFGQTPRAEIRSSGYVVDSLLAAVWLNFQFDDYRELVLAAVNLGEDTDTIAHIAALVLAARERQLALPEDWVNQLIMPDSINEMINNFVRQFST